MYHVTTVVSCDYYGDRYLVVTGILVPVARTVMEEQLSTYEFDSLKHSSLCVCSLLGLYQEERLHTCHV